MMKNVLNFYFFCIYFKKRLKNDLVIFRFVLCTPQGLKTYQSCRRSFQVNSFRVLEDSAFRPAGKLGSILCGKNKTQPSKLEQKGIYLQQCTCSPQAQYVGETRIKIRTRQKQLRDDVIAYRNNPTTNVSGLTRHDYSLGSSFEVSQVILVISKRGGGSSS